MSVPENIRLVERPVNTVVVDNGSNSKYRYAVKERTWIKYEKGKNPKPHNGKTIGHIIDNQYIPVGIKIYENEPTILRYGVSALIHSVVGDIEQDLKAVFDYKDAEKILTIALLKIQEPDISYEEMAQKYSEVYTSIFYQGVALSKNTLSSFIYDLGKSVNKTRQFFQLRFNRVSADHHIAIDGTLRHDTSVVNNLSGYSHKARETGCKDVSIIYALDIELMEPICCKVVPGNFTDASVYRQFISENNITRGIVVADKGFPVSSIEDIIKSNVDLHYLSPLKRNDNLISEYNMLDFQGVLKGIEENVEYKKAKTNDGNYLYTFKDESLEHYEKKGALEKNKFEDDEDSENNYKKYKNKSLSFGAITFLSDLDLDPLIVYLSYKKRWLIELVFDKYKNSIGIDKTKVYSEFSVFGDEFINFIANIITCKVLRKLESTDLFKKYTYKKIFSILDQSLVQLNEKTDEKNILSLEDSKWIILNKTCASMLLKLNLVTTKEKPKVEKRKPGRPRKIKDADTNENKEKRSPGRPRIHPKVDPSQKRPVGRPRKIKEEK